MSAVKATATVAALLVLALLIVILVRFQGTKDSRFYVGESVVINHGSIKD